MKARSWKVGGLAKAVNLTVRTLHHYEEVGLLIPSGRNEGGHRLYNEKDVTNLQQILALKELGLPLDEIRKCFLGKEFSPLKIVKLHRAKMDQEKNRLDHLCEMLSRLERAITSKAALSVEELIKIMEVMNMQDKSFSKEQLKKLAERKAQLGDEKIKSVEAEWPKLIAAVRKKMQADTHPNDPKVQVLAKRWNELIQLFTGGDVEIGLGLREMYKKEPKVREQTGMDAEMNEYVAKMMYCLHQGK